MPYRRCRIDSPLPVTTVSRRLTKLIRHFEALKAERLLRAALSGNTE